MKNWYTITNAAKGPAEISIFGPIGNTWDGEGVTAAKFIKDFKALKGDDVVMTVYSPGGSLFDGLAIHAALVASGKNITARVMGLAASAASVILMAAKRIEMPKNAHQMAHKASGGVYGTADEMRTMADVVDSLDKSVIATYAARSGKSEDDIKAMLDKGDVWLTADQAVEMGFADAVIDAVKVTAEFDLEHLPEAVRNSLRPPEPPTPTPQPAAPVALATQIEALAATAGLEAYAAVFALDPKVTDSASAQAAIQTALDIREFARVANQSDRADALIRARKTADEARAILISNEATVDESTFVDTTPPAKPSKPAEDFSTTNLWTQINAMKAGSKK